jgi:hypothetical protein
MRVRRLAIMICSAACSTAVPRGAPGPASRTRVLASQREVRVVFSPDTSRVWAWNEREDSSYAVAYGWGASLSGMDGPRSLVLQVTRRDRSARSFASLRDLVAAGYVGVCEPGMVLTCKPGVVASVDDNRVVLTLHNPQLVEQLFAMRPATVRVWKPGPALGTFSYDSVPVEYVSPLIPEPDRARRAEAARRKRAYETSVSNVGRGIQIRGLGGALAWLTLGDSARLRVSESQCSYDLCRQSTISVRDPIWTVADSSVATLHVSPPSTGLRAWLDGPDSVHYLVARAPGRTTLRVRFSSLPSDTLPSRTPPPHDLVQDVVVTFPIRAVTIEPRTSSVQVGARVEFRLIVSDTSGRVIRGLPIELQITGGAYAQSSNGPGPFGVLFDKPGTWRLVGRLGSRADTVDVTVRSIRQP